MRLKKVIFTTLDSQNKFELFANTNETYSTIIDGVKYLLRSRRPDSDIMELIAEKHFVGTCEGPYNV